MKSEVKKQWYNSNDHSYKWCLYWVITWKLLFDGDIMTFLTEDNVNLMWRIVLVEEMSKFLAVGWDSSYIPRPWGFPSNVWKNEGCSGEGGVQSTTGGGNKTTLEEGIFGTTGGTRGIILGDNTTGLWFALRDLIPASFFK